MPALYYTLDLVVYLFTGVRSELWCINLYQPAAAQPDKYLINNGALLKADHVEDSISFIVLYHILFWV